MTRTHNAELGGGGVWVVLDPFFRPLGHAVRAPNEPMARETPPSTRSLPGAALTTELPPRWAVLGWRRLQQVSVVCRARRQRCVGRSRSFLSTIVARRPSAEQCRWLLVPLYVDVGVASPRECSSYLSAFFEVVQFVMYFPWCVVARRSCFVASLVYHSEVVACGVVDRPYCYDLGAICRAVE